MKRLFTILLCVLPTLLFAQIKLVNHEATKFYPDGSRITYLSLSDYSTEQAYLDFINAYLVGNEKIMRFSIYSNGNSCFYEALQEITEDDIVNLINEASARYNEYLDLSQQYKDNLVADFFEPKVKFNKDSKMLKEVEFKLLFTEGKEEQIKRAMLNDNKIHEFKIDSDFSGGTCTALVDFDLTPEYLAPILQTQHTFFRPYSIKIYNYQFVNTGFPEDFPTYIETGNPEIDKQSYLRNIDSCTASWA